jgi:2-iminobutanoate/2-iminopropanoate deaminase
MAVEHRDYPDIAPAGPTYSRGTRAGNMLFVSGCTARGTDAQGKPLMEQLDVTLERVVGVVRAEGGNPGDIAKITCFVTSIADWTNNPAKQAELFERFFEGQYPANSLIEISALAEPGLDVEIEAIAVLG